MDMSMYAVHSASHTDQHKDKSAFTAPTDGTWVDLTYTDGSLLFCLAGSLWVLQAHKPGLSTHGIWTLCQSSPWPRILSPLFVGTWTYKPWGLQSLTPVADTQTSATRWWVHRDIC